MRPPKIFRKKYSIAVVGLYSAGKSTFITSLINHIKHHDPGKLALRSKAKIIFDEELRPTNGLGRFPYEEIRSSRKWPPKTRSMHQYRCTFFRSDWKLTKGELELVDIPGERLPDIASISRFTYEEWSDWLIETVFRDEHYREVCQDYLSAFSEPVASGDTIITKYRLLLWKLLISFRPIITPSVFLLSLSDKYLNGREHDLKGKNDPSESGLDGLFAGVTKDEQFAPMPKAARDSNPDVAQQFAARYKKYRSDVVMPWKKTLSRCNELVLLIDVTTLLAANTGMYNGNRALLKQLVLSLSPGKGVCKTGLDLLRKLFLGHWRQRGITRIAVVAPKADLVHKNDRGHLTCLAQRAAELAIDRIVQKTSHLSVHYTHCAAVKSTDSVNGKLQGEAWQAQASSGTQGNDKKGHYESVKYDVSRIQKDWPDEWSQGEYTFGTIKAKFPRNEDNPPDQLGMEEILDFLFDGTTK